jgi:hypothetical protein
MNPERRPRHVLLVLGLLVVGLIGLTALLDRAGNEAATVVAIAAIVAVCVSYVRMGVIALRARGATEPSEGMLRAAKIHMVIAFGAPFVVLAAHPWGTASFVVAGALLLFQPLFLHAMVVAGLILQRRARKAG